MMPTDAVQTLMLRVLADRYAGASPRLDLLHQSGPAFVYRAILGPDQSVVIKHAPPALLAPYATRLQAVYPGMSQGRLRVPEPLFYDAEQGLLGMEDTWGQRGYDLFLQGGDQIPRVVQAAGAWIARFHAQSRAEAPFNPDPHVNWIRKAIAGHKSGARPIEDCDGLRALVPELDARAEAARGAMALRAITHRDFHLRNLVLRKLGRVYGLDFENTARDEAFRDLLFFLTDCAKAQAATPTAASLQAHASLLRSAYNRSPGDAPMRRFFQLAFAMATWAGLDETTPQGPKRRRTFAVIQLVAQADDLFAAPAD